MFALKAEHERGRGYVVTVKSGEDAVNLEALGWLVFSDPTAMLASIESGEKLLNMRYEKREAIIVQLRAMIATGTAP